MPSCYYYYGQVFHSSTLIVRGIVNDSYWDIQTLFWCLYICILPLLRYFSFSHVDLLLYISRKYAMYCSFLVPSSRRTHSSNAIYVITTTAAVISPTNRNSRVTFYCNNQRRLTTVHYDELSMALRQGTILSYCRLMAHPFPYMSGNREMGPV